MIKVQFQHEFHCTKILKNIQVYCFGDEKHGLLLFFLTRDVVLVGNLKWPSGTCWSQVVTHCRPALAENQAKSSKCDLQVGYVR